MHKHYSYSISLLFLLILFSKWNSKCDSFCLTKRNPSNIRNRTFLSCPWGQEENGATEDEMVGWHHWLSGHAFEQTLGDSEGQGSLACCSPWARKELDTTERLNWTEWNWNSNLDKLAPKSIILTTLLLLALNKITLFLILNKIIILLIDLELFIPNTYCIQNY